MRFLRLALAALLACAALPARGESPAPLGPLKFLLGTWVADAKPGEPAGATAFREDLQGQAIVRTNRAEYPAAGGRPAGVHEDLMVVHAEGAAAKALYVDSEGHAIRYRVSSPAPGRAVFESESAPGPRYRLTYVAQPDGGVAGTFEVAAPDKPDAFRTYLAWTMRKGSASPAR